MKRARLAVEAAAVLAILVLGWLAFRRVPPPPAPDALPALLDQGHQVATITDEPVPDLPAGAVGLGRTVTTVQPGRPPVPQDVPLDFPWAQDLFVPSGAKPDAAPVKWPTELDLSGQCVHETARAGSVVTVKSTWKGCLTLPGGSLLCRGPMHEGGDSTDVETTATASPDLLPATWTGELRVLALVGDEPGARLGTSWRHGARRLGYAADLDAFLADRPTGSAWDYRAAVGLSIRLGK